MRKLLLLSLLVSVYSCDSGDGYKFQSLPQINPISACNPLQKVNKPQDIFTLQILHMADQEGNINALEDAPRASSVMNSLKNTFENTVIVSSGDNFLSSPFSAASSDEKMKDLVGGEREEGRGTFGRADILINNALGIQVSTIGNHEFDKGTQRLYDLIKADKSYPGTSFPYLSSNLTFVGNKLNELVVENDQEASSLANGIANTTIITVNGRKVGFIGAVTQKLASIANTDNLVVTPEVKDSEYKNLAAVIQSHADRLTEKGVDIIIVLSHMQQLSIEEKLASLLKNVDIIAGGGSDSILVDENDRLRTGHKAYGKYPLWKKDASGKDVAVVNTDGQYLYIGRLVAHFDKEGNLVKNLHNNCESGAFATDKEGVALLGDTPADPKIVELVNRIEAIIGPKTSNVIAKTDVFLNAERTNIRRSFTNFGSIAADSLVWYAKEFFNIDTVVSIRNSGGIRASIGRIEALPGSTVVEKLPPLEGKITELDIEKALAFDNGISIISLTGQNIIDQLELTLGSDYERDETGNPKNPLKLVKNGMFPQVSGMDIKYEISKTKGSRLVNLVLSNGDKLVDDGTVVAANLDKLYRVATLSFLANGNESIFGDIPSEQLNRVDLQKATPVKTGKFNFAGTGGEQDALAEYMNKMYSQAPYKD